MDHARRAVPSRVKGYKVGGVEFILGIVWLRAYDKVTFDYNNNSMSFVKEGKQMRLKGISEGSKVKVVAAELKIIITEQWYNASLKENCCAIEKYYPIEATKGEEHITQEIQKALTQYEDVF